MSVEELALELPVAERLHLMEALWQSLREEVESSDPPEWLLEALRETQAQE